MENHFHGDDDGDENSKKNKPFFIVYLNIKWIQIKRQKHPPLDFFMDFLAFAKEFGHINIQLHHHYLTIDVTNVFDDFLANYNDNRLTIYWVDIEHFRLVSHPIKLRSLKFAVMVLKNADARFYGLPFFKFQLPD